MGVNHIGRALRLPFLTASILPFCAGSLLSREQWYLPGFCIGIAIVVAVHLSANLINDYADSRSGADWKDKKFYGFFGGSKLIQERVFSERFYLRLALSCAAVAAVCVVALAVLLKSLLVVILACLIIAVSWAYSTRPAMLSYRRLGEMVIFILFGPVPVMGGFFIQTGRFPAAESFLASLPFGFMTMAVLFANEVPDYDADRMAGKYTLVSVVGQRRAFMLYAVLIFLCLACVVIDVAIGILGPVSLFSLLCAPVAFTAGRILHRHYDNKEKLVDSSRLTIVFQMLVGLIMVLDVASGRSCPL